jgi:hypothetical protein
VGVRALAAVIISAAVAVSPAVAVAEEGGVAARPAGVNPYLSFIPGGSEVDIAAWRGYLAQRSARQAPPRAAGDPLVVKENEPSGTSGRNDSIRTAERIRGVGTAPGAHARARVLGQLSSTPQAPDVDYYRVDLRAGDVVGAQVTGAALAVGIHDPAGVLVQGSAQDFSALYPAASPLPRGGNAVADHVASVSGTHYLAVADGSGQYELAVQVHRPPLEREIVPQVIFLDFDGAEVDMAIFGLDPGVRKLSPFSAFLSRWGLSTADEPALARQIVRTVRENLLEDVRARGNNPNVQLLVLNSLEHPDLFGRDNVSRVVVGGSTDEAGFVTVGIAQSIDPGNFAYEETALVLQDFLSLPAGPAVSLNTYLRPESNKIEFIGRAIGNVVAHEIGHYVGSWHTDPANAAVSIMDAGGPGVDRFFGVGPDGVGGTADDTDNDLVADVYRPAEGFSGTEDPVNRTAFGLTGFRP